VTNPAPVPDLHLRPPSQWPPFLTVEEAATILRVARASAYEMVHAGTLPTVRFSGRSIRVPRGALAALAGEQLVSVGAEPDLDLHERDGRVTGHHTATDQDEV